MLLEPKDPTPHTTWCRIWDRHSVANHCPVVMIGSSMHRSNFLYRFWLAFRLLVSIGRDCTLFPIHSPAFLSISSILMSRHSNLTTKSSNSSPSFLSQTNSQKSLRHHHLSNRCRSSPFAISRSTSIRWFKRAFSVWVSNSATSVTKILKSFITELNPSLRIIISWQLEPSN